MKRPCDFLVNLIGYPIASLRSAPSNEYGVCNKTLHATVASVTVVARLRRQQARQSFATLRPQPAHELNVMRLGVGAMMRKVDGVITKSNNH